MTSASSSPLRAARGLLAALAALLTVALLAAIGSPASAHGGPINVEVGQDGLGGVYVFFFYEEDAHPIQAILEATVEGRSSTGEVVAPIPLSSASQGVGIWETAPGAFAPGQWELTVKIIDPTVYEKTVPIQIAMAEVADEEALAADQPAVDGGNVVADEGSATSEPAASEPADAGAMVGQWWPLALGVGVIVIAGVVVVLVARRGRAPVRR